MNKTILLLTVFFLSVTLVSAFDSQTIQICGGDNETLILCIGDEENSPMSAPIILSGKFNNINWTRSSVSVLNSSNEGTLIFNNTFSGIENISLYNLTNALLYNPETLVIYLNSTISNNTGNFTNISISPDNLIYILDDYNLTEGINRENSPINITRISPSSVLINSNLQTTISGVEIILNQDCNTLSYISYQSDSGLFSKVPPFSCSNNLVSIPASELLEIETGQDNQFIIYTTQGDTGSSGGGTPSSSVVQITPNITSETLDLNFSRINLEKVEIQNKKLCIGDNNINFKPLDNKTDFTLIDSARLYINNSEIKNKLFLDSKNERYYFFLEDLGEGAMNITISATQKGKTIDETKSLNIERCTAESNLKKLIEFIKDNPDYFFYCILIFFVIILVVYIIYRHK